MCIRSRSPQHTGHVYGRSSYTQAMCVWYNKHAHRLCVYGIIVKRHRLCVLEADPHSTQAMCMVEAVTHRQCVYGIIKNIFNKNERRCRDVKTQKACKQGWEANIGPKITSI